MANLGLNPIVCRIEFSEWCLPVASVLVKAPIEIPSELDFGWNLRTINS
jgi:hypothetical protein